MILTEFTKNMRKQIFAFAFIFLSAITIYGQEYRYDTIPKYSYGTVNELWQQFNDVFEDPNFSNANWGVVIQSLSTGEYFYKKNENKLIMPASNLKLFTSAAALLLLGNDYTFKTEIYRRGVLDGSILKGDLIVRGFGDPTISGRFYNDDFTYRLNLWADSLLNLGIDEIQGNIIGDDDAFDDIGIGEGWPWDHLSEWYLAPSGALSYNDNCVEINVIPSTVGVKPEIKLAPDTKYITIVNNAVTVSNDSITSIKTYRDIGTNVISVYGTIKANSIPVRTYSTINNPTQYTVVVLKEILEKKGIKVKGYAADNDDMNELIDYDKTTKLFTDYSPPLSTILKVMNKNSLNFYAEQLLKIIGYEKEGLGTAANGIKACLNLYTQMGINTEGMVIVDGSGISRLNLVTPNQINNLLSYMYKSDMFPYFYDMFPIAGVDGTIANRMEKSRATNNVRGKTGYINNVRSLSGYVYTGDRELVSFSIIVNNFTVPMILADNIQDLICLRLASFKRK
jgi:D-alanyl-D-alanine carboxypeptidase/D-alanyl-D-alanine-endopeptidase (penicillin-binding protein 4)